MEDSFSRLQKAVDECQQAEDDLALCSQKLSAGTETMLLLMRMRFNLVEDTYAILRAHWSPTVLDAPPSQVR